MAPERPRSVYDSIDWRSVRRSTRWHATDTTFGWRTKIVLSLPSLRSLAGLLGAPFAVVVVIVTLDLSWWLLVVTLPLVLLLVRWEWSVLKNVIWVPGRVASPSSAAEAPHTGPAEVARPQHATLRFAHGDDPDETPSRW